MDESKYGKYIITELVKPGEKQSWSATYREQDKMELLNLNDDIIKGAFYVQTGWFWPAITENKSPERSTKPHSHTYDEVIGIIGTNPDDPRDLCGEIEIWLGDEKHIINKSCLIFLPAGLEHGPFREIRVDRPIFHFDVGMAKKHI